MPDLKDLMAYGTDDEEALSSAFAENFERTTHLRLKKVTEIHSSGSIVQLPSNGTTTTLVVPSKDNPTKPHIVNVYPIGKCEYDNNCPGYGAP